MGMRWRVKLEILAVATALLMGVQSLPARPAEFVAGLNPSQRPAGAPVITEFRKDPAWYARALRGVVPPYPQSLRFLESQGAWFAPFSHAGMSGPYDIRGLHGANYAPIVPIE